MYKEFNVRVEYEPAPIRHIAVQCPDCLSWFYGYDALDDGDSIEYDYQIKYAHFTCPLCEKQFGSIVDAWDCDIKEVSYPEVYKDCFKKKTVTTWGK